MTIDSDLIESLEDQYDSDDNFEQIIPKSSPGRKDSKRVDKSERNKIKKERRNRREGHWGMMESMSNMDYGFI